MTAAVDVASGFNPVTNHPAAAVFATRCQGFNGAFEAVKGVGLARHNHIEGFVVVVSAFLASCHSVPPLFVIRWAGRTSLSQP